MAIRPACWPKVSALSLPAMCHCNILHLLFHLLKVYSSLEKFWHQYFFKLTIQGLKEYRGSINSPAGVFLSTNLLFPWLKSMALDTGSLSTIWCSNWSPKQRVLLSNPYSITELITHSKGLFYESTILFFHKEVPQVLYLYYSNESKYSTYFSQIFSCMVYWLN